MKIAVYALLIALIIAAGSTLPSWVEPDVDEIGPRNCPEGSADCR